MTPGAFVGLETPVYRVAGAESGCRGAAYPEPLASAGNVKTYREGRNVQEITEHPDSGCGGRADERAHPALERLARAVRHPVRPGSAAARAGRRGGVLLHSAQARRDPGHHRADPRVGAEPARVAAGEGDVAHPRRRHRAAPRCLRLRRNCHGRGRGGAVAVRRAGEVGQHWHRRDHRVHRERARADRSAADRRRARGHHRLRDEQPVRIRRPRRGHHGDRGHHRHRPRTLRAVLLH